MEKAPTLTLTSSRPRCRWLSVTLVLCILIVIIVIAVGVPLGLHYRHKFNSSSPNSSSLSGSPPAAGLNKTLTSHIWKPKNGTTWQIILLDLPKLPTMATTASSTSPQSDVWDIDLFDNPTSTISQIHDLHSKVICYFSAGTCEDWRPDASQFQPSDLGSLLSDWPGERWLNISSPNVRTIMLARLDLAVTKRCNGVDPDNMDGYDNGNGLGLTQADAVAYIRFFAEAAHGRNLSMGLKNAGDVVPEVVDKMEWSVQEQCIQYGDCESYRPFIDQGKPVFHVEYSKGADVNNNASITPDQKTSICTDMVVNGFSTIIKNINLDQWIESC